MTDKLRAMLQNVMGHIDTPIARRRLGIGVDQPEWLTEARAALAAAPQPAVADQEALVEVIDNALRDWSNLPPLTCLRASYVANDLLARGLRLPGGDETMAWAAIGPDGKAEAEAVHFHREIVERDLRDGERIARVAIRVVEGNDDAA